MAITSAQKAIIDKVKSEQQIEEIGKNNEPLNFFDKYSSELALTGAILAIIVIIVSIVFLAKKYSYIRTMLLLSVLYLMLIFLPYGLRYEEVLVMSLPVLIFWGIRFIKHGASGIFKDKTKD